MWGMGVNVGGASWNVNVKWTGAGSGRLEE